MNPKISIVTIVRNNAEGIAKAIESFNSQNYDNKEHIIIDACSTDGTLEVIRKLSQGKTVLLSEPDKGIYNALNKGILMASGDIIGILHSDDLFASNDVLSKVADGLADQRVDGLYADLQYISKGDQPKVVRHWVSGNYGESSFNRGWMPPHPTLFLRQSVFEKHGMYREDLKIAADYEFMLRVVYKKNIRLAYLNEVVTLMTVGGASNGSLKQIMRKTHEDLMAWTLNSLPNGSRRAIIMKNLRKVPQFFQNRKVHMPV